MLKPNTYFNIKWLLIAVLFTAIVILLTHIPEDATPSVLQIGGLDKLAHSVAYGAITFLFILSLRTFPSLLSSSLLFFTILAVGTIDELTQPFVNRTASLVDWLADAIGVAVTLLLFIYSKHAKRQVQPKTDTLTQNADS
jgi:VanZ family protein